MATAFDAPADLERGSGASAGSASPLKSSGGLTATLSPKAEVKPHVSTLANVGRLAVAVACGIVFGWVINKSGVNQATVLRDQFNFENFVMLSTSTPGAGTPRALALTVAAAVVRRAGL